MSRIVLPLVLLLIGSGAGIGLGLWLAPPAPAGEEAPGGQAQTAEAKGPETNGAEAANTARTGAAQATGQTEFVRLNNQFVVPLVARDRVAAMVVLSLSVEVRAGAAQAVYAREPKLRDGFLQVLFDHANRGGFDGAFTEAGNMEVLRRMLMDVARDVLGADARGVLITEIARQDA